MALNCLIRFNFFQHKLTSGQRRELFSAAARADELLYISSEFLSAVDALCDARQRLDRKRRALIRRPVGHGIPAVGKVCRNDAGQRADLYRHLSHAGKPLVARDTIDPLLGAAPDAQLVRQLAQRITAHPDVLGIHDLMVHDYGPGKRFASVHVEMDAHTDVLHAHEVIDGIERTVKKELNIDLVIHYDPVVTDDAELSSLRGRIEQAISRFDPRLSVHDFRMVRGKQHTNVIFDMVVPEDLQGETANLRRLVNETLHQSGDQYFAVITFDCEAFNELSR